MSLNVVFSAFAIIGAPEPCPAFPSTRGSHYLVSALLASLGIVYGLGVAASAGWSSGRVVGSLIAAAVLLGAFVVRQIGHADRSLLLRVVAERNCGLGWWRWSPRP